jgi:hypothetical protein
VWVDEQGRFDAKSASKASEGSNGGGALDASFEVGDGSPA